MTSGAGFCARFVVEEGAPEGALALVASIAGSAGRHVLGGLADRLHAIVAGRAGGVRGLVVKYRNRECARRLMTSVACRAGQDVAGRLSYGGRSVVASRAGADRGLVIKRRAAGSHRSSQ